MNSNSVNEQQFYFYENEHLFGEAWRLSLRFVGGATFSASALLSAAYEERRDNDEARRLAELRSICAQLNVTRNVH